MGTDYTPEPYEETVKHFSNKLLAQKLEDQVFDTFPFEEVLEIKEAARRLRHMRTVPKS